MEKRSNPNFLHLSVKFLTNTILMVLAAVGLGWVIIRLQQGFTLWALIPLLIGLPLSILVNVQLVRKLNRKPAELLPQQGDSSDEQSA
jgi:hypothetical protein